MFQDFIINSQPILDCNMPNSRLKHPKSDNDKFKPVSEIISFFWFEKLSYCEEKGGRLVFNFSQVWTFNSHNFLNLQSALDCNIPIQKW